MIKKKFLCIDCLELVAEEKYDMEVKKCHACKKKQTNELIENLSYRQDLYGKHGGKGGGNTEASVNPTYSYSDQEDW